MALELDFSFLDGLEDAAFRALEKTADALLTDVTAAQVMPRDTGVMQEHQTFVESDRAANRVSIVTAAPQAHRLYTHPEYTFTKDRGNANARGEWLEPWISGEDKDRPRELFEEFFKQEAKL